MPARNDPYGCAAVDERLRRLWFDLRNAISSTSSCWSPVCGARTKLARASAGVGSVSGHADNDTISTKISWPSTPGSIKRRDRPCLAHSASNHRRACAGTEVVTLLVSLDSQKAGSFQRRPKASAARASRSGVITLSLTVTSRLLHTPLSVRLHAAVYVSVRPRNVRICPPPVDIEHSTAHIFACGVRMSFRACAA